MSRRGQNRIFKTIDGSRLEGGGQIVRMAVALSGLLNQPIIIENIRSGRPKPGLAAQHLHGLLLAQKITNGELNGAKIGSTNVRFVPHGIKSGQYRVDTGTAGSVSLILQTVIPLLVYAPGSSSIELLGGTHVPFAPFIDFFGDILNHYLPFSGPEIHCHRHGFYPKGGGKIQCRIDSIEQQPLPPIVHIEPSRVENTTITGFVLVSGSVSTEFASQTSERIENFLRDLIPPAIAGTDEPSIRIDVRNSATDSDSRRQSDAMATMLVARSGSNRLSASSVAGRNQITSDPSVAERLWQELSSGAAVDQYVQDQLIIYMALASGQSKILSGPVTLHTETAIWIAEMLTGAQFRINPSSDHSGLNIIECQGIAYQYDKFYG